MSEAAIHEICMTVLLVAAIGAVAFIVWCVTRHG